MAVNATRATGYKVLATDWNDLAALANAVESAVNNATTGNVALGGRVTTAESKLSGVGTTSDASTGTAGAQLGDLRSRAGVLESKTTGLGTTSDASTGTASAQLTSLRSRATALETLTGGATTGNTALGNRVSTLEAGSTQPPTCILLRTTNFDVIANTDTVMPWSSAEQNDSVNGNAMWSSGTPQIITIRQAGVYDIGCIVHSVNTNGMELPQGAYDLGPMTASIVKNSTSQSLTATQVYQGIKIGVGFFGGNTIALAGVRRFAAGDVLRVIVYYEFNQTCRYDTFSGPGVFWASFIRS